MICRRFFQASDRTHLRKKKDSHYHKIFDFFPRTVNATVVLHVFLDKVAAIAMDELTITAFQKTSVNILIDSAAL